MFGKSIYKITYHELQKLLKSNAIFEGHRLDFKEDFGSKTKEIAKDVSSFANANGGFLIYGIDDDKNICGVDKITNDRGVVEWFNQAVSGNVEPSVFYYDPSCIEIPESDKIVIIIEIPESSKKPHMLTSDYRYYTRINDSSMVAKHFQVRDMFMYSRDKKSDFSTFYENRNLDKEKDNFAETPLSIKIKRNVENSDGPKRPLVVFSIIPKYLDEEIFKGNTEDNMLWLKTHQYINVGDYSCTMYGSHYDLKGKLDGYVSEHIDRSKAYCSYFELLTNGYLEAGFSSSMTYTGHDDYTNKSFWTVHIDMVIGYYIALLKWAKEFYEYCDYREEFLFQVSITDALNARLYGFKEDFNYRRHKNKQIRNEFDNNIAIPKAISTRDLDDDKILKYAIDASDKIHRTFGLNQDYLFENSKYPSKKIQEFDLYGF